MPNRLVEITIRFEEEILIVDACEAVIKRIYDCGEQPEIQLVDNEYFKVESSDDERVFIVTKSSEPKVKGFCGIDKFGTYNQSKRD